MTDYRSIDYVAVLLIKEMIKNRNRRIMKRQNKNNFKSNEIKSDSSLVIKDIESNADKNQEEPKTPEP